MKLRLVAPGAIFQQLDRLVKASEDATFAVMSETAKAIKQDWQAQVQSAFKGRKLINTIKSRVFRNRGFDPAAIIYTKAPKIMEAHSTSKVIVPRQGKFMAIPTENVPRKGGGRYTPKTWDASRFGELVFVPARAGKEAMLIAQDVRKSYSRKTGEFRGYKRAKSKAARKEAENVVMFILVKQAKIRDRLDIDKAVQVRLAAMPALMERKL